MTSLADNRDHVERCPTESDDQSPRERVVELLVSSWWTSRVIIAVTIPPLVFFALRPERYGLVPNYVDPVFYTGYAINLADIMRELGDSRYFVTR